MQIRLDIHWFQLTVRRLFAGGGCWHWNWQILCRIGWPFFKTPLVIWRQLVSILWKLEVCWTPSTKLYYMEYWNVHVLFPVQAMLGARKNFVQHNLLLTFRSTFWIGKVKELFYAGQRNRWTQSETGKRAVFLKVLVVISDPRLGSESETGSDKFSWGVTWTWNLRQLFSTFHWPQVALWRDSQLSLTPGPGHCCWFQLTPSHGWHWASLSWRGERTVAAHCRCCLIMIELVLPVTPWVVAICIIAIIPVSWLLPQPVATWI